MSHAHHRPRPPLDRFIDSFEITDEDYVGAAPRERVLPTGGQALVVQLGSRPMEIYPDEDPDGRAHLFDTLACGARSRPLVIGATLGAGVCVIFKPGGARPFLDVPAEALTEQTVSLEALWGSAARSLRERLLETATPLARVRLLEDLLLARLRGTWEIDAALGASLRAFGEPDLSSVAEVGRRVGLSSRRLLALFREEVGLSPKTFWRIQRFRGTLCSLERRIWSGAALAAEAGYFDQAHFNHEFRRLAGQTPGQYLAARALGGVPNHVPLQR